MALITQISAGWAQLERELLHGLSAQEVFVRFIQSPGKAEYFLQRLTDLRNEYERLYKLLNTAYPNPKKSAAPTILIDFDVLRAYIDDEFEKHSDYLHIRHFFEVSKFPYTIPVGAMHELKAYLKRTLGLGQIPQNRNYENIFERLKSFILEMVENESPQWSDNKVERRRVIMTRLLRVLSDERFSTTAVSEPRELDRREIYTYVKAAIEVSSRHANVPEERRKTIAFNDSLSLAVLQRESLPRSYAPSCSQFILLTKSRYLIRAASRINTLRGRVVTPRLMSLLFQTRPSDGVGTAKANIVVTIASLNSVHNAIRQQTLDSELRAGEGTISKRIERQTANIWKELKSALSDFTTILGIEGRRGPLLSYEWVREELAMEDDRGRRKGAAVSYLKMLSVIEQCISATEKSVEFNYRSVPLRGTTDAWKIEETALAKEVHIDLGSTTEYPEICRASLIDIDIDNGDLTQTALALDWKIDAGWFPMVACLEDEYLPRLRDIAVDLPFLQPFARWQTNSVDEDDLGITFVLPQCEVVFPASWIAASGSLSFMRPWNLRKELRQCVDREFGRSTGRRHSTRIEAVKISIPHETLEFDVDPRAGGMLRMASLVTSNSDKASRISKIWVWIGGRVGNLDRFIQCLDDLGKVVAGDSREVVSNG